jgi:hypothetical protein
MKYLLMILTTLAVMAVLASTAVAGNPSGQGQPSQTCLSSTAPQEPGNAASASGSAFNESSPGTAGTVYAGNGANTSTPANGAAVSQYDVACYQVSHH